MSMSRKDYEAIADAIRETKEKDTCGGTAWDAKAVDALTERLTSIFEADNPNFDPGRFRRACQP